MTNGAYFNDKWRILYARTVEIPMLKTELLSLIKIDNILVSAWYHNSMIVNRIVYKMLVLSLVMYKSCLPDDVTAIQLIAEM